MFTFLLLLYVLPFTFPVSATNYCARNCGNIPHIGCSSNGQFSKICLTPQIINIDNNLKQMLIDGHNERRNFFAGGGEPKLTIPCRMATMQWNDELAALAVLNVKECKAYHDNCHETDMFQNSGQNVALYFTTKPFNPDGTHPFDVVEKVKKAMDGWYAEVQFVSQSNIDSGNINSKIGHFTELVNEANTHLGCAIAVYGLNDRNMKTNILIVCNYARINMITIPVYKTCRSPAASCTTGTNPKYPNLCSVQEPYDVNDYSI